MVQAPEKVDSAQQYRQKVEELYCWVVVHYLQNHYPPLQVDQLKLSASDQKQLKNLRDKLPNQWHSIEHQVCRNLLLYVQEVKRVHQRHRIAEIETAILEDGRERLGISSETASVIRKAVRLTASPSSYSQEDYQKKRKQYDDVLAAALRKNYATQDMLQELHLLQHVLKLSDDDLIPPELLKSDRGINYIPLWRKLQAQQWQDACRETTARMAKIAKQNGSHSLTVDAKVFPCTDLQTIDSLWRHHSHGRFGFSVQQAIWQELKGNLQQFGERVGWCRDNRWLRYEDMTFSLQAERGHLPVFPLMGWWCWADGMKAMVEQFGRCTLTGSRSPHS